MRDGEATDDPSFAKRASVDVRDLEPGQRSASVAEREDYPLPTEEEARTLRKVADSIPNVAWMLCIVELAERASYYGVQVSAGVPRPYREEAIHVYWTKH